MLHDVEISAWITFSDTSSIGYRVEPDGQVELSVGGPGGFVLETDELGLQHLIVHSEQALRAVHDANASYDEDCEPE